MARNVRRQNLEASQTGFIKRSCGRVLQVGVPWVSHTYGTYPKHGPYFLDTDPICNYHCFGNYLSARGRKLNKSMFAKSDSTLQYTKDGKKRFQGAKGRLRETQVYPPEFGRKVPQYRLMVYMFIEFDF